jgi:hypothetical protein
MTISLEIYKKIRDNKALVIKNFYYHTKLNKTPKLTSIDITEINEDSKIDKDNIIIYKILVLVFNNSNVNVDSLICYTTGKKNLFKQFEKIYNDYNNYISGFPKKYDDIVKNNFKKLLHDMAKNDTLGCDSLGQNPIQISKNNLEEKIKNRNVDYGIYKNKDMYPDDKKRHNWLYIIYDDIIYHLIYQGKKMFLCKNANNSAAEYDTFIEFVENVYSPLRDAMDDPKNIPGPTFSPEKLIKRNSISDIADIGSSKQIGKYTSKSYFDKKHPNPEHLKYTIKETMACFRNDKDANGKIILGPANANYRREPFLKQVLNFPPKCKNGKNGESISEDDLKLVKKIKSELNDILTKIKNKYPPPPDKDYFLIDLEGGAGKHFDYSLYAFTENELNQPQDTFLVKSNLWKKLEFKSYQNKKTIAGLSNYLSKSPLTLFDTVNSTFGKEFLKHFKNKNINWIRTNVNGNEYFAKAIENILQGQKNKIYIIWNVNDEKIYLDEFPDNELKIKRENGIPKIDLDEEQLKKGIIRIRATTVNDVYTHQITYSKKLTGDDLEINPEEESDESEDKTNGQFRFNLKRKIATDFNTVPDIVDALTNQLSNLNTNDFVIGDKVRFTFYRYLYDAIITNINKPHATVILDYDGTEKKVLLNKLEKIIE